MKKHLVILFLLLAGCGKWELNTVYQSQELTKEQKEENEFRYDRAIKTLLSHRSQKDEYRAAIDLYLLPNEMCSEARAKKLADDYVKALKFAQKQLALLGPPLREQWVEREHFLLRKLMGDYGPGPHRIVDKKEVPWPVPDMMPQWVVDTLIERMDDSQEKVAIVIAVGRFGKRASKAIPALQRYTEGRDEMLARFAFRAIQAIKK